ncbi:hypothetical protein V5O48_018281, partial [Marasmius crinis-equi]
PLLSREPAPAPTPSISMPKPTLTNKAPQISHPLPQRPTVTVQRPRSGAAKSTTEPPAAGPSSSASRKHSFNTEDVPRATKKAKKGGGGEDADTPSLLSRLATTATNGRHPTVDQPTGSAPQQPLLSPNLSQGLGQLSIKGAARLHHEPLDTNNTHTQQPREATPTSLMARLDGNEGEKTIHRRQRKRH